MADLIITILLILWVIVICIGKRLEKIRQIRRIILVFNAEYYDSLPTTSKMFWQLRKWKINDWLDKGDKI